MLFFLRKEIDFAPVRWKTDKAHITRSTLPSMKTHIKIITYFGSSHNWFSCEGKRGKSTLYFIFDRNAVSRSKYVPSSTQRHSPWLLSDWISGFLFLPLGVSVCFFSGVWKADWHVCFKNYYTKCDSELYTLCCNCNTTVRLPVWTVQTNPNVYSQ